MTTPPVVTGITVEHFAPHAFAWCPNPVVVTWHGREVADHQHERLRRLSLAQKADDTEVGIVAVDPGKAPRFTVAFIECRGLAVECVQILYPALQVSMRGIFEEMPVQTRLMVPLVPLTKLPTHEEEFFAGLGVHITQEQSEVGEFLQVRPGHLAE